MISDGDRAEPNGQRGQSGMGSGSALLPRSPSTYYPVPVKCPSCGKAVEAAEMPNGAIIYIGTMMTTLGERYRRYDTGKERLPVVIRTRNMAGYPRHKHE